MMITPSWMLSVGVEIAEEGRMWVFIVHSLEQVESCSFLELHRGEGLVVDEAELLFSFTNLGGE